MNDFFDDLDEDNLDAFIPGNYLQQDKQKPKSGFFDLPGQKFCQHPEHDPPRHLHIPQGKGYRHVCSSCGKEQVIIPQQTTL